MEKLKIVKKYIIAFIITLFIMFLLFAITSTIPQNAISKQLKESAKFYEKKNGIEEVQPRRSYTFLHYYLDSTELNIIYCMDTTTPIKSAMWANYYETLYIDRNDDFIEAVNEERDANKQYLRYWHGSIIILRPLLAIFNIKQIYLINNILLIILAIILFAVLWKKSEKLSLAYLLSLVMIVFPIIPQCLAYSWTFYIMLIVSIIAIHIEKKGNKQLGILFLITGMLTCFFDLLTTEIITLFVPLIFVLIIRKEDNRIESFKQTIRFIIKLGLLWAVGYFGMWFAKWILASVILNINAIEYVKEQALLRINGLQGIESKREMYIGALTQNWHSMFPINIVKRTSRLYLIFVAGIVALLLTFNWKKIRKQSFMFILLLIATIPYIRYLVLANHSYRHYFFTFRIQIITLIAVTYIIMTNIATIKKDKFKIKEDE